MTVEELEILITAKTEEAVKELEKIMPAIKQMVKQVQETFSKMDAKEFQKVINKSVQQIKKQLADLKKSSENNQIEIKVTNTDAINQIKQVKKEIDALHKKTSVRRYKHNKSNKKARKR